MSGLSARATAPVPGRPIVAVLDDWEGALERLVDWRQVRSRAELRFHPRTLEGEALVETIADADVLVLNRDRTALDPPLLARLPHLRYVVFTGQRNRRIDFAALRARGIPVSCTEGGPALASTTEHAWALILAWARGLDDQFKLMRNGGWRPVPPMRLARVLDGDTLGLIGLGRIGSRMAAIGSAFGMQVVAWSPHLSTERAAESGARAVSLDELLRSALVVSLHLVPSPDTQRLINAERLASMRGDALLVNTARAELIDHDALVGALHDRRIDAAALDVLPNEPAPAEDRLRGIDGLLITPHSGFCAEAVFEAFARGTRECLDAWLDGAALPRRADAC
jgi:phosphoglycerate dehydrogenase-like enzyme